MPEMTFSQFIVQSAMCDDILNVESLRYVYSKQTKFVKAFGKVIYLKLCEKSLLIEGIVFSTFGCQVCVVC